MAEIYADSLAIATKTALIVPVEDAEMVLGPYRQILDHTAAWPVPAHVTVLYPFVLPGSITETVLHGVRSGLSQLQAFTCTFSRIEWFGENVMWLAPEPDATFGR